MHEVSTYDSYRGTAVKVAKALNPRSYVEDDLGKTFRDYVSDLELVSVEAQSSFRDRFGFFPERERRYVNGALYRRAHYFRRQISKRRELRPAVIDDTYYVHKSRVEGRIEARAILERLKLELGARDFSVLGRWAEAGGCTAQAHNPLTDPGISAFGRDVRQIRMRAKELFGNFATEKRELSN